MRRIAHSPLSAAACLAWLVFALAAGSGWSHELFAAGPDENTAEVAQVDIPLVTVNVASIERLLEDVDYTFESVDRPELAELISRLMFRLGDLKGLDLNQPLGCMVFVQPGLPPTPVAVGYVPVTNIDDLKKTVARSAMTLEDGEGEGRYELRLGAISLFVRLVDGYAFLSTDPEMLEKEFPKPAAQAKQLTSRYDVGASLDLKSVPRGLMTLFLQYLRANVETDLQQRDNESDVRYALRKAQGMSNFDFLDQMLLQGEELLLGWNVSADKHEATLELIVNAAPESQFAKAFKDIAGRRSYFAPLLEDAVPLSASSSWKLSESTQQVYVRMLNVLEAEITANLGGDPGGAPDQAVKDILASLSDTVDLGHLDGFLQFQGTPPEAFVLIGGLKVANGNKLAAGLGNLLRQIQERQSEGPANIELNAVLRNGVSFHRIGTAAQSPAQLRLFGENAALYVGVGQRAVWVAYGSDGVPGALDRAMQKVDQPDDGKPARNPDAPFQLLAHLSSWMAMTSESENRMLAYEAAREAFSSTNDVIRVEFRPTDNGARLHIVLAEGFIRYVGFRVARTVDRRL